MSTTPELSEVERIRVQAFGLDQPAPVDLIKQAREYERRGMDGIPVGEGPQVIALLAALADALAHPAPQPNRETIAALLGISDEYFDAIQGGEHENWSRLIDHLWKVSEALKAVSSPPPAPPTIDREALRTNLDKLHRWTFGTEGEFTKDVARELVNQVADALSAQTVEGEVTDEQVEAAAKAIWDSEPYVPEYEGDTGVAWEDAEDSQRDIWRTGARAALEAAKLVQP